MHYATRISLLVVALVGCRVFSADAREWKLRNGRIVQAEFVRVHQGRVVLNWRGRIEKISPAALSPEDRAYVEAEVAKDLERRLGPIWTDVRGRKTRGRFRGFVGGEVRLEIGDQMHRFDFATFCPADRDRIRGLIDAGDEQPPSEDELIAAGAPSPPVDAAEPNPSAEEPVHKPARPDLLAGPPTAASPRPNPPRPRPPFPRPQVPEAPSTPRLPGPPETFEEPTPPDAPEPEEVAVARPRTQPRPRPDSWNEPRKEGIAYAAPPAGPTESVPPLSSPNGPGNLAGIFLILGGGFTALAALADWDWYMNLPKPALMVSILGRPATRIFYVVVGSVVAIVGGLAMIGVGPIGS